MTPFKVDYQSVSPAAPQLGEAALLPWDSETFGFPVGELRLGDTHAGLDEAFTAWAERSGAELVSCEIDPGDGAGLLALHRLGFLTVELSLFGSLPRLARRELPPAKLQLRIAAEQDQEQVKDIAGRAFRFGRYHTDPRFPDELANARFGHWMARAFASDDPADRILVLDGERGVLGFFHIRLEGGLGDLRLVGIDPERNTAGAGYELIVATLHHIKASGARGVTAKLAAANTPTLNVYAGLGFQFHRPRVTLHWHAPGATHLRWEG